MSKNGQFASRGHNEAVEFLWAASLISVYPSFLCSKSVCSPREERGLISGCCFDIGKFEISSPDRETPLFISVSYSQLGHAGATQDPPEFPIGH